MGFQIEVLDLSADRGGKRVRVEDARLSDATLAREQALPDVLDGVTHRGDPAHSGDDDSVHTNDKRTARGRRVKRRGEGEREHEGPKTRRDAKGLSELGIPFVPLRVFAPSCSSL